jgi:hypothetical protein
VSRASSVLAIPGTCAHQHSEYIHPAAPPFVALYEVDGREVFNSAVYRANAGPGKTENDRARWAIGNAKCSVGSIAEKRNSGVAGARINSWSLATDAAGCRS